MYQHFIEGLQRLGRALMLPIAILPIAGLLLRLGDTDLLNIAVMHDAGQAIFANLALIFAIGIAVGFARDNNGTAGLAGAIGYLVMISTLKVMDSTINMGMLAGIASGLMAGGLTLAVMVACNVWAKGLTRLLAPLVGLLAGMGFSLALGLVPKQLHLWQDIAWVWIPDLPVFGWAFEPAAIVPYVVTGFALALTSMGTQTIVQRSADADWVRPDLRTLAGGVRAEGLAHLFASLVNGLPMAASDGAVSLAAASGCASRYLGYWTAGLLILAAFMPKLIGAWLLLPAPVMGALLLYLATFTTLNGLQLITSRMLDNRRVLAVGMGLMTGVGIDLVHRAMQGLWPALNSVALSGLAAGVCVTVVMSTLFRIGLGQGTRQRFVLN